VRCIACDFDLAQTTDGRCPECGRAFDRQDNGTYIGEGHSRVARRSAAAPGWPMFTLAALLGYLILCTDFSPTGTFMPHLSALLAGLFIGGFFLVRLFVALAARAALPKRRPRVVPVALWRWLTPIAIVLVAMVIVQLRVPRMMAFGLDRAVLQPVAVGSEAEPSAFLPVEAWTGRVTKGAVWDDIEITAIDPAEGYGAEFPPGWGWVVEQGEMRGVRRVDGAERPVRVRVASVTLPRLAIFPIEGTGYGRSSCAAWVYAPGAPDVFFLTEVADSGDQNSGDQDSGDADSGDRAYPGPTFLRYSGDWFVSKGWMHPLEDRSASDATTPATAPTTTPMP